MRFWRRIIDIIGMIILLGIFIGMRMEIHELRNYKEQLMSFTKWDEYGSVPLLSAVTGNRSIYKFNDYVGEDGLTYEFYYHSAVADAELAKYGEYLELNGYAEMTLDDLQNDKCVIAYQRQNPQWDGELIHVTAWHTDDGFILCISGL